jgi:hypothetical protein
VRDASTKIIRDLEGRAQAYDLSGPEARPVPMRAADQPLVTALQQFRVWSEQSRARTLGPLSPAELERLRSLGYIQ